MKIVVIGVLLVPLSCFSTEGGEAGGSAVLEAIDPMLVARERYGTIGPEDVVESFSRIVDATMTDEEVVVLDGSTPFVRVIQRASHRGFAFATRGEGPGEIIAPYGLEIAGIRLSPS